MIEFLNLKRGLINLIVGISSSIITPLIMYYSLVFFFPIDKVFDIAFIIVNGIIFTLISTAYGLFHRKTFVKFIIGIFYLIMIIYFFYVGNNIFSGFLPHKSFAHPYIQLDIMGYSAEVSFDYFWLAISLVILKGLTITRAYIKPLSEKEESKRYKVVEFIKTEE